MQCPRSCRATPLSCSAKMDAPRFGRSIRAADQFPVPCRPSADAIRFLIVETGRLKPAPRMLISRHDAPIGKNDLRLLCIRPFVPNVGRVAWALSAHSLSLPHGATAEPCQPGTGMPQPTRGVWFGSGAVLSLVSAARCRTRRVNRKGRSQTSEVRNQKLKKEETSEKSKWKIKDGRWNSRSPGDTEPDKAAGVNGEVVAAKRRATVFGVAVPAAAAQQSIAPTPRPLRIRQRVRGATEPAK